MKLLLAMLLLAMAAGAQVPYATPHAPLLGSAWYPEQWPEDRWDADLALMEQAHMNVVRIGEFAWSTLEPSEGRYELDWMERAVALAAKHHIAVVIGTPTDAPPAWLTAKYPDTLGMNADGHWREHGGRRQFNYASPRYRALCGEVVAKLAERFGHNPDVVGWQIGNEYTDESFDPATKRQFQAFLKAKYKTLASLNEHWATSYWSQTYDRWDEIPMVNTGGNPGLLLEHKHFVTATWRSFQRVQVDVLRSRILPTQFITTNIGGLAWSDNWDHYAMTADLDLASWDEYVGSGHLDVAKEAMLNDFVRGWKRQNFWVMETQPGSVNWSPLNNALAKGETRALAWQAIGHGADAILYWQWRAALNGQEQYHGAIVGPDGKPLPLYPELQQLGEELAKASVALAGTSPQAEIAILHNYDSRWAIDFQPHTKEYDQQQVMLRFYQPLEEIAMGTGHAVDVVDPALAPLDRYKLLVAPSLNAISAELATRLVAYVKQGGHLLLGPRSGMKDEFNSLNPQRQPGPLAELLGGHVDQYYALDEVVPLGDGRADTWAEPLLADTPDAHVLLRFGKTDGGWLDDQPAMLTRAVGKGSISYLGALPDAGLLRRVLGEMSASADIAAGSFTPPANVELCVRTGTGKYVAILINHGADKVRVELPKRMHDLLQDRAHIKMLELPSQGVAILTLESDQ